MVKFTEVYYRNDTGRYSVREVTVNPHHVVAFREDEASINALNESKMALGFTSGTRFTRIFLNSGQSSLDVIVAGSPDIVEQKILNAKRLLKG